MKKISLLIFYCMLHSVMFAESTENVFIPNQSNCAAEFIKIIKYTAQIQAFLEYHEKQKILLAQSSENILNSDSEDISFAHTNYQFGAIQSLTRATNIAQAVATIMAGEIATPYTEAIENLKKCIQGSHLSAELTNMFIEESGNFAEQAKI